MPVNGPGGRRPPPPTTTPTTTPTTAPALEPPRSPPLLNTEDTSALPAWQPNRTRRRTQVDDASAPLTSDTVMQHALDRFRTRFESILHLDAVSLARGHEPWRDGQSLSDQQQRDLIRATTDLLEDTPISRLSPDLQERVEDALRTRGMHRDLSATRLGDLGDVGGDLAKSFAEELRGERPGAFYGLGASAAALIGYAAWDRGSDGMRALGVRPEVRKRIFNDQVRVGVGADFDAQLSNVRPRVRADFDLPGQAVGRPDFRLGADARFTSGGELDTLTTTGTMTGQRYSASVGATMRGNELESVAGAFAYDPNPNFSLSAGALYDAPQDRLTVGAEAMWRLSRDAQVGFSATHDSEGDTRVGVGARVRF